MIRIERLNGHDRRNEFALACYVEVFADHSVFLRINIIEELRAVELDIPVTRRREAPCIVGNRAAPPAIPARNLLHRNEGSLARSGEFHETTVLIAMYLILGSNLVADVQQSANPLPAALMSLIGLRYVFTRRITLVASTSEEALRTELIPST